MPRRYELFDVDPSTAMPIAVTSMFAPTIMVAVAPLPVIRVNVEF
jgi:hypothetical protein